MSTDAAHSTDADFWEWRRLSQIGQQVSPGLFGRIANFVVTPVGQAGQGDGVRFVRARCSAPGRCPDDPESLVLLKVKESDWQITRWTERPIKVLQARLVDEPLWRYPLLDCCGADTVLVTQINTAQHEVLTVAELFTGGFMGWTQGSVVMHQFHAPISVKWGLEKASDCIPMQRAMIPGLQVIDCESQLQQVQHGHGAMPMIVADVNQAWWLRMFEISPVNTWTVSAPCQPWSVAGLQGGLSTETGRIMLRLVDLAMVFQPRLVLFEQVAGFPAHKDYPYIMSCWREAGYQVTWRATLELADIMPCSRSRHLLVLVRDDEPRPDVSLTRTWGCRRASTLGQVNAIFDLPWDMLSSHIPSEQVLTQYLCPEYMPQNCAAARADPFAYRVRGPAQVAGCFLAQYGSAHLLPHEHLARKGLFGNLLAQGQITRFFTASEVASLHCTVLPTLSCRNRRLAMRMMGNAIAVPHAAVTMLKGCQAMGAMQDVSPSQVVAKCVAMRLHNNNAVLLPAGPDWVLCRAEDALAVIKDTVLRPDLGLSPSLHQLLQPLTILTDTQRTDIWLSPAFPWQQALQALGYPVSMLMQATITADQPCCTVVLPYTPLLPGTEDECAYVRDLGCIVVAQNGRTAVLPQHSVAHMACLTTLATENLDDVHQPRYMARVSGSRLHDALKLPPLVMLLPEEKEPEIFSSAEFAVFGTSTDVQVKHDEILFAVPARHAFAIWRGWPVEHITALGWGTSFQPPLPDGSCGLHILLRPQPGRVHMTVRGMLKTLAMLAIRSRLQCVKESQAPAGRCQVEVQLVAHTIWAGELPADFRAELLLMWWSDVASALTLCKHARLFSGPHSLPPGVQPSDLTDGRVGPVVRRKSGHVLLSIHPTCQAGGSKEETKQWAMTRLATLALGQGAELAAASTFVNSVVDAVGAPKLAALLNEPSEVKRWEAVVEVARARDVAVPELASTHAKVEAKVRRAANRQKIQHQRLRAADLCPSPGFFVNADGTPAAFLDSLSPGASGIYLADPEQASELVETLRGVQPDELAILIVGPAEGAVPEATVSVSFPAQTGDPPAKVLIAGQLCNLGGKAISTQHAAHAEVELQEAYCCQFVMYRDEMEPDQWLQITQAPVRFAAEAFKQSGVVRSFASAWARAFLSRGRPAAPLTAEISCFHARVEKDDLEGVLRSSGHNFVYAVPKQWNKQPHADYAIVWLGASRSEAVRAALQCCEQKGIIRNRDKYGIRVRDVHYGKTFAALQPGKEVPKRIPITQLHRAGPFPVQAGAADIAAWAAKCNWQVRVLKSLGEAHWLLGSSCDPPSDCISFNGSTILLSPIKGRDRQKPTVQSGVVPKPGPSSSTTLPEEDPWVQNDPWKSYRKSNPAHTSAAKPLQSVAVPSARTVSGPTESRFQEQDSRIGAIEQSLKELKQQSDERYQQSLADRKADAALHQTAIGDLRSQIGQMSSEFARQLQTSVESLQGAQAQQMQQVMTNFDDLKSLLSCREREPSKKPRVAPNE